MEYTIKPIGVIQSCFKEKFCIPRQPGLATHAKGVVELFPEYSRAEAVRGLEAFSHIWLIFLFHQAMEATWRPTVRPPRLGGNQRLGVFATRSPFRPNHMGLSVVALDNIEFRGQQILLHVSGLDLVEGTPVLDIKPYLSYVDSVANARGGFAETAPPTTFQVVFTPQAAQTCEFYQTNYPGLRALITQILSLDPRPAYSKENNKEYGMRLYDFDLRWRVENDLVVVLNLAPVVRG